MVRDAESFDLAYQTLRTRLRQRADPPGQILSIKDLANELGVSPTPVREALARLSGEGQVSKVAGAYARPRLDADDLSQLLALSQLHLLFVCRRARTRAGGAHDAQPKSASWQEVTSPADAWRQAEALFEQITLSSGDRIIMQAHQRLIDRLTPIMALQTGVLDGLLTEIDALAAAATQSNTAALQSSIRKFHGRRIANAARFIVADKNYISNIAGIDITEGVDSMGRKGRQ